MTDNIATLYTDQEVLEIALMATSPNVGKIREGKAAYKNALSNNKTSEEALKAALDVASPDKASRLAGDRVLFAHGKLTNYDYDAQPRRSFGGWFKERFSNSSGRISVALIVSTAIGGVIGLVLFAVALYPAGVWLYMNLLQYDPSGWFWVIAILVVILFACLGYLIALRWVTRTNPDPHTT